MGLEVDLARRRSETCVWRSVYVAAYLLLERLGDDSPTNYWRVLAAEEIMRLYRDDPTRLQELDLLHGAKESAEEVLHPPSETVRFADAADLQRAWESTRPTSGGAG